MFQLQTCKRILIFKAPGARLFPSTRPWQSFGLVLLFTNFLTVALACKCFLHTLLLTWLQVKRMTLYFLDDVLGLHFALEAAQGILQRFTFLYSNFCQRNYTSQSCRNGYL